MSLATRKAIADCEAGGGLKNFNKLLKEVSDKMTGSLDFESIKALNTLPKIKFDGKNEDDGPVAVLKYFTRSINVLESVAKALKKIASNPLGKEALQEEVEKVIVFVVHDEAMKGNFEASYKAEKKGKELHVTVGRNWIEQAKESSSIPNSDDLAKMVEAML